MASPSISLDINMKALRKLCTLPPSHKCRKCFHHTEAPFFYSGYCFTFEANYDIFRKFNVWPLADTMLGLCSRAGCQNAIFTFSHFSNGFLTYSQGIPHLRFTHTSLNYFVLKTPQVRVRTTPPDVVSSVKKLKPLLRGPVLLKKSRPSLRGEGINTHTQI